jgi:molybdopterin molybdotransferase
VITPTIVTIAAAVGKTEMLVKKLPKVLIISTGDELVDVHEQPTPFQIRRSNNYALHAVLTQHALQADMQHLPDDKKIIEETLSESLKHYDVILLSGGVSMGKFDYVPAALEQAGVTKFFHKIKQRPGKPFWFGIHADRAFVFAFPGNPVASFLCLHRYFLPWIKKCFDIETQSSYAILNDDFHFDIELQHFLQVKLKLNENGELLATPVGGNGSGDFVNLLQADAFMELPLEKKYFKKGESFKIWTFKQII